MFIEKPETDASISEPNKPKEESQGKATTTTVQEPVALEPVKTEPKSESIPTSDIEIKGIYSVLATHLTLIVWRCEGNLTNIFVNTGTSVTTLYFL